MDALRNMRRPKQGRINRVQFDALTDEEHAGRIIKALGVAMPTIRLAYQMLTKDGEGMRKGCIDAGEEHVFEMLDGLIHCTDLLEGVTADMNDCIARLQICTEEMTGKKVTVYCQRKWEAL